jgi:hypothetical protein
MFAPPVLFFSIYVGPSDFVVGVVVVVVVFVPDI